MRGASPRELCSIQRPAPKGFTQKNIKPKQKTFEIDVNNTTPLSWEILRGDAIRLTFIFKENDSVYDDSGATKFRVFCYGNKGKTYFFGDEFAKNNGEWIAQFESERTSGNAGASVLTAQLLDNDGNLINSANINLLVIESNTTTPFVSSPHFKDDALAEIEQAVADAKIEIDNWSDQSNRLAKLETATQDLQLFKSNSGALHFNNGRATTGTFTLTLPFTAMMRVKFDKDSASSGLLGLFSTGGTTTGANRTPFFLNFNFGSKLFQMYCSGYVESTNRSIGYNVSFDWDNNVHTLVWVVRNVDAIGFDCDLYIDGLLQAKSRNSFDSLAYLAFNSPNTSIVGLNKDGGFYNIASNKYPCDYNDIYLLNFDASAEDAPYTLSDYQQGKTIPTECLNSSSEQRALLALENYTIKVGNSQKVLDYSGNANDATCSGTVKGDNDTRISAFVNAITGK